jgi:hypothetical protein
MSLTSICPRGNPLTESMPFTAQDGTSWLAYIEGVPHAPIVYGARPSLPPRRLRFDSANESRVTAELPAGSPFLSDARLETLLDRAQPIAPPTTASWEPIESTVQLRRAIEWSTRAGKAGVTTLAGWARRWREGADRRRALRRQAAQLLAGAIETTRRVVARFREEDERPERAGVLDDPIARRSDFARRWRGARSGRRVGPR